MTTFTYNLATTMACPFAKAGALSRTARDPNTSCLKTFGCSLGARALYVAQIIASLIAIPLLLIATLFSCCSREEGAADGIEGLKFHFLLSIFLPFKIVLPLSCCEKK